jgi:hypothetical protein
MRNTVGLWMTGSMLAISLSATLDATMITGNETAAPFGMLNQNATDAQNNFLVDCHSGACSPVSVVNAWAYLQGPSPISTPVIRR